MHLNFNWTTGQVLWTLKFAALLVLLVVLLGRERSRRFKWFTISIVLLAFRLLASRLLYGKMAPLRLSEIFIVLADLLMVVNLLVLIELARRVFGSAKMRTWIVGALALVAVGALVLAYWGPWPAWKTMTANSLLAVLRLMQLVAQKGDLLADLLAVELGLLVVVFGRRFKAGWRSHAQQITIGLSTAAMAELAVQGLWQLIAMKAAPHTQVEYERIIGLREKLFNGNEVVYLAVVVWWIVCLWMDEPGVKTQAPVAETIDGTAGEIPAEARSEVTAETLTGGSGKEEPSSGV